ncbi:two-component system response regulator [Geobacter sp. SVR]|uniref:response regulator n=1 Tax=Geobacter sp. SVR TaxID=2495594 RepID=UPI00143EF58A|nr:two-component system response regulator [Geobacter sp. SVR]BCS52684.1 two-component system response regulator [Geobacter sp. SVR]GCF86821.1 two-component system response regulator [Geobacter sp. SVR]
MNNIIRKNKVLIVDDSNVNVQVLMETLRDEYAIIVATSGHKALQMANLEPRPDIILLDINMPEMDGYEVCRKLKSDSATESIPIIFITALSEKDDEKKGLELGAVDYIIKPFSPDLVRARVRNHLELKRHRDFWEDLVQERTSELALVQDAAIYGLGILAEYRDPETGQHIRRTQLYIRLLAERLKDHPRFKEYFDQHSIRSLYNSAPLHDIGKVGVPDHILRKPGPLTADEFNQMKLHTIYGRDTVSRIGKLMKDDKISSFLKCAEEITYTHHERWDGTGYHGLAGDEIPVSGRLMALADVYDALVSKRVYKTAYAHEQAFMIITRGDGRTSPGHFDPDVLQAFVDVHGDFREISLEYQESAIKALSTGLVCSQW